MKCPLCDSNEDRVLESRQNAAGTSIRRRRECLSCGYRFTSYEHIEEKKLMVVKRDGRRQPFDLKKLERGIQISLEKRPVSQLVVEDILQEIEEESAMLGKSTHEITSSQLGEMVLEKLYKVDRVAYVRFASVYRMFDDVEQFIDEIGHLSRETN
jgi:transcriptional repressor NrdR